MKSKWRENVEQLVEFLEADRADRDKQLLASLVYFVGEVESDGLMSYFDLRDTDDVETLARAARLIGSEELRQVVRDIQILIDSLPQASDLADRISLYLEQFDEDPFEKSDADLCELMPAIEIKIQRAVSNFDY